jgi:hypothetical protein
MREFLVTRSSSASGSRCTRGAIIVRHPPPAAVREDSSVGEWVSSPRRVRESISRAVDQGVPAAAVAFYARWWELETWLRQLVYTELRAKYGVGWLQHLAQQAPTRAARDEINRYMATPDASNVLAYLDVAHLFDLIGSTNHWPLFEPSLVPKMRWDGTVQELRELRHRNAHCRRPHADDLTRVEQVLSDLQQGARTALESHKSARTSRRTWPTRSRSVGSGSIIPTRTGSSTTARINTTRGSASSGRGDPGLTLPTMT